MCSGTESTQIRQRARSMSAANSFKESFPARLIAAPGGHVLQNLFNHCHFCGIGLAVSTICSPASCSFVMSSAIFLVGQHLKRQRETDESPHRARRSPLRLLRRAASGS